MEALIVKTLIVVLCVGFYSIWSTVYLMKRLEKLEEKMKKGG